MFRTAMGRVLALLVLGLTAFAAVAVHAYEVSPMRIFLVPAEGRSQATISINNTRDEPLPVELKIFRRTTAEDGSETMEEADDAFIVFPPQVQVPANASQAIRLQYVGPAELTESTSYLVQVVEVPVSPEGFSGVRFTYNFGVAVYVEPPRAVERISVVSAERSEGRLRLTVRNSGNKHGLLHQHRLLVNAGGQQLDLTADDLANRIENPVLPPNMDRVFNIEMPELAGTGPISAELRSR